MGKGPKNYLHESKCPSYWDEHDFVQKNRTEPVENIAHAEGDKLEEEHCGKWCL